MLTSPHPYCEWIMLYGESGCGKSHGVLSFADAFRSVGNMTGYDTKFYFVDTDAGVHVNIENFPELQSTMNTPSGIIQSGDPCYTWPEVEKRTDAILKVIRPKKDWLIVDRVSYIWELAPRYYVESRLKTTLEALELEYRQGRDGEYKAGSALLQYYAGGINPMYKALEDKWIFMSRANVILVSHDTPLNEDSTGKGSDKRPKDDNATQKQFKELKSKPACQKGTPFKMHTILQLSQPYLGKYQITTARERGARESFFRDVVSELGVQYLMGRAKWQLS